MVPVDYQHLGEGKSVCFFLWLFQSFEVILFADSTMVNCGGKELFQTFGWWICLRIRSHGINQN